MHLLSVEYKNQQSILSKSFHKFPPISPVNKNQKAAIMKHLPDSRLFIVKLVEIYIIKKIKKSSIGGML